MTSKAGGKFAEGIEELSPTLSALDDSIKYATAGMQYLLDCPKASMTDRVSTLHKAKMDLISMYCANSMFWVYLKTQGVNPAEHPITKELDRVKALLKRVKEIEDKKLAPKVNKDASKRVMRNALWTAAHKPKPENPGDEQTEVTDRLTGEVAAGSGAAAPDLSLVKAEKSVTKSPSKKSSRQDGGPSKKKKKKH